MKTEDFPENDSLVGQTFEALAFANYSIEDRLTKNKVYQIKVISGIFKSRPIATFMDDNGKQSSAHLSRFKRILPEEIKHD